MLQTLAKRLRRLLVDDDGPTAVEYAVMVSLIAGAVVVSVNQLSTATKNSFNSSGAAINGVLSP